MPIVDTQNNRGRRAVLRKAAEFLSGARRKIYGPITHVRTRSNTVALTFDDGPHPDFTVELLRILKRFNAKATFFMVGRIAARYPAIVKMVAEEGHAIGNHSLSHVKFPDLDSGRRRAEIEQCEKILHPYSARLFRPPFGEENLSCHRDALRLGYQVIGWDLSADDWREHSPDSIAERLLPQLRAGSIVLMHDNLATDSVADQRRTLIAVEKMLGAAQGKFTFCTVPQLLTLGRPLTSFGPV
jgi:peptidoglycan-N-acetylglucosamine deacetylase